MSTPSILGFDGGSLARRMSPVDDDAPTLSMPAVGGNPSVLPWQVSQWHLSYSRGDVFASASVSEYDALGDSHDGNTWQAVCAGSPGRLDAWFPTAEAALAAVEEHIAAHVEAHLSEVSR